MRSVVFVCVALAGCAGMRQAAAPRVVAESSRSIVISAPKGLSGEVTEIAERSCAAHGLHARLIGVNPGTVQYVFDCVQ